MRTILPQKLHMPQLIRPTRRDMLGGLAAGVVVAGTPLGALSAAKAPRFRPPPHGHIWTYDYTDGRTELFRRLEDGAWITWTVVRYDRFIDDEPMQERSYNVLSGNWMVTFDAERTPLFAADPDDRQYRWPISVGGFWRSKYTYRDYRRDERFKAMANWKVVAFELRDSIMGRVRTVRLHSDGERRQIQHWFAWDLGVPLREVIHEDGKLMHDKVLARYEVDPNPPPPETDGEDAPKEK
ncbi:MAG: hypothetical protein AAF674_10165 [Pseudomonadota bacterium]